LLIEGNRPAAERTAHPVTSPFPDPPRRAIPLEFHAAAVDDVQFQHGFIVDGHAGGPHANVVQVVGSPLATFRSEQARLNDHQHAAGVRQRRAPPAQVDRDQEQADADKPEDRKDQRQDPEPILVGTFLIAEERPEQAKREQADDAIPNHGKAEQPAAAAP
jgi:hypothetical protein